MDASANEKLARLIRSRAFRDLSPVDKLLAMTALKPFEELLRDGDIYDVQGAAQRSGYTPQHVRRLCHEARLEHLERGLCEEEVQFFFLPEQIRGLFTLRRARARA